MSLDLHNGIDPYLAAARREEERALEQRVAAELLEVTSTETVPTGFTKIWEDLRKREDPEQPIMADGLVVKHDVEELTVTFSATDRVNGIGDRRTPAIFGQVLDEDTQKPVSSAALFPDGTIVFVELTAESAA